MVAELLGDRTCRGVRGVEDGLVILVVVGQRGNEEELGLVLDDDLLEAVDELALAVGDEAIAVIKASDVMVAK